MTFIAIIKLQDGFLLIGDTMISDDTPLVFSMNNQKVFISKKHRLGLCICDRMLLVHKQREKSDIYVSHILREFFQNLEREETVVVSDLQSLIIAYIDEKYPEYENFLRFHDIRKKDSRDCNYLFGGFLTGQGTSIYSHFAGIESSIQADDPQPAFFSNHGETLQDYLQQVADKLNVTVDHLLAERREELLYEVVPLVCSRVNAGKPYCVGKDLHAVHFQLNGAVEEIFYQYSVNAENLSIQYSPIPPISYATAKTLEEEPRRMSQILSRDPNDKK